MDCHPWVKAMVGTRAVGGSRIETRAIPTVRVSRG